MKLFYCYSQSHELLLRQYFLPTLPASFEPEGFFCESPGNGDFKTPGYLDCIDFKVSKVLELLEQHAGGVFVMSDIDILFFRDPVPELERLLSGDTELLLQREGPRTADVNPGFFACRATPAVRGFFQQIVARMKVRGDRNEQFAANDLIHAGEVTVPWDYLPLTYYARTHGWPPPADAVLYHANFTPEAGGVHRKVEQFEEIRWVRKYGRPAWLWSCAKRIPGKLWRMTRRR